MLLNVVYIGNRACCAQSGCTLNMKNQRLFKKIYNLFSKDIEMVKDGKLIFSIKF
jgi:hypothetical protein